MRLREGYVIQDQVVVESLLARGRHVSAWGAHTGPEGAGACVVITATYDATMDRGQVLEARARIRQRWDCLRRLHTAAVTAIPTPLALLHQYNPDPAVRGLLVQDPEERTNEPYLVCGRLRGKSLPEAISDGDHDEDHALALCLRIVQLVINCARAGYRFERLDADDLNLSPTGVGVLLVDVGALVPADPATLDQLENLPIPAGVGRILLGLLTGTPAPAWPAGPENVARWRDLLAQRRIVGGTSDVVMGLLRDPDGLAPTCGVVTRRLQGRLAWRSVGFRAPLRRSTDLAAPAPAGHLVGGRYRIVRMLAQGARGFVYLAVDLVTQVEVVVKCGKYQYDAASSFALELPTRRAELVHEAAMLRRFASRCGTIPQPVALVHDVGMGAWFSLVPQLAPGEPWLVMRPLPGRSLIDAVPDPHHDGRLGPAAPDRLPRVSQVLRWVAEIARTLQVLHEAGYLFQDLKPDNLLYDEFTDTMWLVDLASVCPFRSDGTLDRTSVAFGVQTHGYAAPEFATLWERVDTRFDVYALGACAWFWLTGINPERVALSAANEYPTLDLAALQDVPEVVADVVRRCLAPRDERFRSMEEVAAAAARAALALSRSRPLEVRDLRVVYVETGPQLVWERPDDPRIVGVRVCSVSDTGEVVRYAGSWCAAFAVDTEAAHLSWRVQTVRQRGGELLHSLGRTVRVDPTPPVTRLVVLPDFGGVRVEVAVPAHATGLVLRSDVVGPPASVDEGDPVQTHSSGPLQHARVSSPPDRPVFVSAFAQYGASLSRVSAVRVQSCVPLGSLPFVDRFESVQHATGVVLAWSVPLPGAFVEARVAGAPVRRLTAAVGARTLVDTDTPDGARVAYMLYAQVDDVVSEPCASVVVSRWPSAPRLVADEGFGRVTLSVVDPEEPRLDGWVDACLSVGDQIVWWPTFAAPQTGANQPREQALEVEGDKPLTAVVHFLRGDVGGAALSARGPLPTDPDEFAGVGRTRQVDVCVPAAAFAPTFVWLSCEWPIALSLDWPAGATGWTGTWTVSLVLTTRAPDTVEASERILFTGAFAGVDLQSILLAACRAQVDAFGAVPPGQFARAALHLIAPDGTHRRWESTEVLVEETLPAPRVVARLGELEVFPYARPDVVPAPPWYEVEFVIAGASPFLRRVEAGGVRVEAPDGALVEVRSRRGGTLRAMPWSDTTHVEVLRTPAAPRTRVARQGQWGWRLRWSPVEDSDVGYVVRRGDGVLVYEGVDTEVWDLAGKTEAGWTVCALRRGVSSTTEPFVVAQHDDPDEAQNGTIHPSPLQTRRAESFAKCFPGTLLRTVRVETVCVAELLWRGAEGVELVVLDAVGAVVGRALTQGARVLLIWEDGAEARWIADAEAESGQRVPVPAPVAGGFLAACVPREGRIVLADTDGVVSSLDDVSFVTLGQEVREVVLSQRESLRLRGVGRGGQMACLGSNAAAGPLAVAPDGPPLILVAAVSVDGIGEAWRWAWRDVLAAWQLRRSRRLVADERAVLVRVGVGAEGHTDLVANGLHVRLQLQATLLRRSGHLRAQLRWTSRASVREWSESVRLLGGAW